MLDQFSGLVGVKSFLYGFGNPLSADAVGVVEHAGDFVDEAVVDVLAIDGVLGLVAVRGFVYQHGHSNVNLASVILTAEANTLLAALTEEEARAGVLEALLWRTALDRDTIHEEAIVSLRGILHTA